MTDTITLTGLVATPPMHIVTSEGLQVSSFRLAASQRRYDRATRKWVDSSTNWYTITCFRRLAVNVVQSIQKGQRIVVTGKLRIRDFGGSDRPGAAVEVEAEAIGHDLSWGTTAFTRSTFAPDDESEGAETDEQGEAGAATG